jgi:signal peptidase I
MRATWRGLRGYALVDPACGVWPVRTLYTEDLDDDDNEDNQTDRGTVAQSAINIGVNRVAHGPYIWVSFLDVLSSKLTTGVFPKIIKTRTLKPVGRQKDLKAIKFFGDDDYIIDLTKEGVDLFKRVIDMRGEIKVKRDECIKGSDEYNRLDAMQMALKLIANATSYGILVQFDVDESNAQVQVDVYYGDKKYTKEARETIVGYDGTRKISGFKAEKPGKWFSPGDR